jgi:DNA-binding NarL/FixJ family response regulator
MNSDKPISVLLLDRHHTLTRITKRFLQAERDIRVVTNPIQSNVRSTLTEVERLKPDVVIVDMPTPPGLKVISPLRAALPHASIIALTLLDTDGYRDAALAAGADAFVSKANLSTDLLPSIREAVKKY